MSDEGPGVFSRLFVEHYTHIFVIVAHAAGLLISVYLSRWDLFSAGLVFGILSLFLFFDLSPRGKGILIGLVRRLID